jgi:Flp pilus assembly protein TadD
MATFICETVRTTTGADINPVSYVAQIEGEGGPRGAFVNVSNTLAEVEWLQQLFEQSEIDLVTDGLLHRNEDGTFKLDIRYSTKGDASNSETTTYEFDNAKLYPTLHTLIKLLASKAEVTLPPELAGEKMEFGTDKPETFLKFLEGYDALQYIQQVQGRVAPEFSPEPSMDLLAEALTEDPDFLGPYETLVQLCRMCVNARIGTFDMVLKALNKAIELCDDDHRAIYVLGEAYQSIGDLAKAAECFEKAALMEPNDPGLHSRLGYVQMMMGMPANAELNFRKAVELEGDDKPSMDLLAGVLQQTNREHEIPAMWKELVEKNPQNAQAHAKYAISLMQCNREEDGIRAFDNALEVLEDNTFVKRFYAPVLVQKGELDRAMDFYEDCLDATPTEIPILLEYAQTLQKAQRDFEIPNVLRTVLSSNPDPNTRAQTQAWLLELEQKQRTDMVEQARDKMDNGDFEGAIKDLKPMRNWLADYWKLWALLSAAYNRTNEPKEAEDAARRLLDLFPGCEPGYGELLAALGAQGRHEEGYSLLRFAASNNPQSLPIHLNLALAAKRFGKEEEARSLAKQIREAVGPNPDIEPVLAEIER